MTLDEIKQEIKDMDPNLSEESDVFKAATLLLAALVVGADDQKLADFTGLNPDFIAPRAQRLRENGIWVGENTSCNWDDGEAGAFAFWLDVNVAEGLMEKRKREPEAVRDPETPEEWQEAVNFAYLWLLVDSARQYGLITGGDEVDVARCQEILDRGFELGIVHTLEQEEKKPRRRKKRR